MIVDSWFYDGVSLVKEGAVFLKGGESRSISSRKGDLDGGGSSVFFLS